ncbi:MAG: class I SAM-dependent methyltransferase [Vampirovibrio sp.]|nr:class I SAM-dependent methyltransferase [Vampirovibrio sp.]
MSLRKYFRKKILPLDLLTQVLSPYCFEKALDVGAGTGMMLEHLYEHGIIRQGVGVEVASSYFRTINDALEILSSQDLQAQQPGKTFDLIVFNDVLHHVKDKPDFIQQYISQYLKPGGLVFIKDMDNAHPVYTWANRCHDLVFAGEWIHEIDPNGVKGILPRFGLLAEGKARVLWYDHYYLLFQCPEAVSQESLAHITQTTGAQPANPPGEPLLQV